jgi:hypothetical protein
MSSRLIDHIIDNLNYDFDDFIKYKIKEYYVPKHVDIDILIYEEYKNLIPKKISTLTLSKVLRGIVSQIYDINGMYNLKLLTGYSISVAYLNSIGDSSIVAEDILSKTGFELYKEVEAIIGYDIGCSRYITLNNIIHDLVGDNWKNIPDDMWIGFYLLKKLKN